jgi:hypothetical protein
MYVRLVMLNLQTQQYKILVIHSDLQSSMAREAVHLHPCTALVDIVVEVWFLDLAFVLCAVIYVGFHRV